MIDKGIKIQNIYHMLAYAFSILKSIGLDKCDIEKFENAADLLSAILSKGISNQIKRGLGKEYISATEPLSTLRGKINVSQSIKEQTLLRKQLICSYDDFSVNTYLNQIIKTTIDILLKSEIKKEYKKELRNLIIYFREVSTLNPYTINWNIRFNRNNATYQMLIGICNLVIKGLLQKDEKGNMKLQNFLDERRMSYLYEKFILEYYKKHFPVLKASAQQINWFAEGENLDSLPKMQSDVVLKKDDKMLIIDAKYYSKTFIKSQFSDKKIFHSHNLYQIYTYVKNKDRENKGNVSGMLLYAKTDEESTPNASFDMGGNKIMIKTLDLGQDFEDIEQALSEIADF